MDFQPELLILDNDGVLIDSEIISARMLIATLAERGIILDEAYVAQHYLGRSYPVVMEDIRRSFGIELPAEFEEHYRERLLAAFERDLKILPGVGALLDRVDLPVAVATSSSPRRVEHSLRLVGLWERLGPVTFTASQVPRGKPAPDLFLHVAQRFSADPAHTLVIEDSLTGVRAGLAAGMQVWRYLGGSHMGPDTPPEPEEARPHRRFSDFADLTAFLPQRKDAR